MDSMDMLKHLTPDQAETYMKFEKTFETEGWDLITTWAEREAEATLRHAATCSSWDENRLLNGRADAFSQIVSMRASVLAEYENTAAEAAAFEAQYAHEDDMDSQS